MMSINKEIENWVVVSTFFKLNDLPVPVNNLPFSTFTGLYEERTIAGYNPERMPAIIPVSNTITSSWL